MASINVYVDDELKQRLDDAKNILNLSVIAQECWKSELDRLELPQGDHVVDSLDSNGEPVEVRFTGSLVESVENGAGIALTDEGTILSFDDDGYRVQSPTDPDWTPEGLWDLLRSDESVAEACAMLGIKNVVEIR